MLRALAAMKGMTSSHALVVERFLEKTSGHTDLKSLVCTSCHGEHRLPVRTVRWDRKTGKLVARSVK